MRGILLISLLLSIARTALGQEVFVPMWPIEVSRGTGSELTDTYRWNEGEKHFVLYAYGVLESEKGKRLSVALSKGNHVYNLWAGHFDGNLALSYIDYSGGFGVDRLCLVAIEKHKLWWCKRVASQVVKGYRAALSTGLPLDEQFRVRSK